MRKLTAIFASLAIIFFSSTAASALPVGSPNQISDYAVPVNMGDCGGPGIGYNASNGKTLAAWTTGTGSIESVEFTLISEDGTGSVIGSYTADADEIPSIRDCQPVEVSGASDGSFLIVWVTNDSSIAGLRVDENGTVIGSHFVVSSHTNYDDIETVAIVWSNSDQRYLVAWKADVIAAFPSASGNQQLAGRFIEADGTGIGADFQITDSPDEYDNSMGLTFGDGVWAAVGGNDGGNKAYVTFISPDGTLSDEFPCSAQNSNTSSASIAYNADTNEFACVWRSNFNVYGNFLDSSGNLREVTDLVLVDAVSAGLSVGGKPRIDSLGVDGWIVTWQTTGSADVSGAQVDGDGLIVGEIEFVSAGVNNSAVEKNFRPDVSFSPATGYAYIVWSRQDRSISQTEMYSRAWYITEGLGVPSVEDDLAATGVDAALITTVGGLLIVAGLLVFRRRRAA